MEKYNVGGTVTVGILRDGERKDIPVILKGAL
jgi:hypothetical protein